MASSNPTTSISNTISLHRHRHAHQLPPPPHVLLLPFPAQGHTIPLLNLAKFLASKGVAVTYVCVRHRISRLQRDHAAAGLDPLIRLVGLPERVPIGELGIDEGIDIAPWMMEVAASMENDFVQLMHELRTAAAGVVSEESLGAPIAVVYDVFLWWALDVVVSMKMNYYTFFTSPASALSVMLHMPLLISQGYVPLRLSVEARLITLPGLAPTWDRELLYFVRDSKAAVQKIIDSALKLTETQTILINTCHELEPYVIDALQNYENVHQAKIDVRALGPLLPLELSINDNHVDILYLQGDNRKQEETGCLEWLDSQSPASVLYVSFGSIFIPSLENITELALGLEASTHAFLWVLRPPPGVASRDKSFSISKLLPEGFESRTKDRGFIISPTAPQLSILSHTSTGGFLTHCGWNSTLESVSMGVPLIAYPQFAEQKTNCRMIVDQWKVGIQLETDENERLRKEDVEKVVRILMEGEEGKRMKGNVRQLRDITRRCLKKGGSSYTNLQVLVQELFKLSASSTHEADNRVNMETGLPAAH